MVPMCDFNTGFKAPEPNPVEPFHHRMDPRSLPGKLARKETWAKCDMLATVSLGRLDRVMAGRGPDGKRIYVAGRVIADDLRAIRRGVMIALGLVDPS